MVFESGAILQYLLDNYQNDAANMNMNEFRRPAGSSAKESAQISSWIVWANAQLEPICCIDESTTQGRSQPGLSSRQEFYGRPGVKFEALEELNDLLGQKKRQLRDEFSPPFLVGDKFTLADVAIASYLLYIPRNFPKTNMGQWPHLISYMRDCALRQGFSAAFGTSIQNLVLDELDYSLQNGSLGNDRNRNSLTSRRAGRGYVPGRPDDYEDNIRRSIGNVGNGQLY